MTKSDLQELFKDNEQNEGKKVSAVDIVNISKFAFVSLQMDGKTLDYYYEVSIDELVESEMPDEEYIAMKEQGWVLNNNTLIKYI